MNTQKPTLPYLWNTHSIKGNPDLNLFIAQALRWGHNQDDVKRFLEKKLNAKSNTKDGRSKEKVSWKTGFKIGFLRLDFKIAVAL